MLVGFFVDHVSVMPMTVKSLEIASRDKLNDSKLETSDLAFT